MVAYSRTFFRMKLLVTRAKKLNNLLQTLFDQISTRPLEKIYNQALLIILKVINCNQHIQNLTITDM